MSNREILVVPGCVISWLGFFFVISAPGSGVRVPLWFGAFDFVLRNGSKSGSVRSWMIPGGSWMSSGEY